MSLRTPRLFFALALLVASIHGQTFTDVASIAGIAMPPSPGVMVGRGACVADFNGDGLCDLIIPGAPGEPFRAYLNVGGWFFIDVSPVANLGICGDTKSCTAVDYDNDGNLDLFICNRLSPNRLYKNNGLMMFTEVGAQAGLDFNGHSWVATWGDYDRDGFLDLYVGCRPIPEAVASNHLYHNNGNGTFTEVTTQSGTAHNSETFANLFVDYDRDGWPDLWVTSDLAFDPSFPPNALYHNNHDGTFTNVAAALGVNRPMQAMGIDVSDPLNDGRLMTIISNTPPWMGNSLGNPTYDGNSLHRWNPATQAFDNVEDQFNAKLDNISWSTVWMDYDNDGLEDIFLQHMMSPATIVRNTGNAPWQNVGTALGFLVAGPEIAGGIGDLNNDGCMDVIEPFAASNVCVMRNPVLNSNHWLKVKLVGTTSNRDGVGAELTAYTAADGVSRLRLRKSGQGMIVGSEPVVHFGLGANTSVTTLTIKWPSGTIQIIPNVGVDQRVVVTEPTMLLGSGQEATGAYPFALSFPGEAAHPYIVGLALGISQGIPLGDGRVFPLDLDFVLEATTATGNPYVQNGQGTLNGAGVANGAFLLPAPPALTGVTLYSAAITLDLFAPLGVRSIAGPVALHF